MLPNQQFHSTLIKFQYGLLRLPFCIRFRKVYTVFNEPSLIAGILITTTQINMLFTLYYLQFTIHCSMFFKQLIYIVTVEESEWV